MKNFFSLKALAILALACGISAAAEEAVYYTTNFKASNLADISFTALDSNGDGTTWTPQTSTATFRALDGEKITDVDKTPVTIASGDHNDWLITPGIRFEAGKTYEVELIGCKYLYAAINDAFEVKMGTAKKATSMTTELLPLTDGDMAQYGGNSMWTYRFTVAVDETNDYYIGIHATGKPGQKFGFTNLTIANGVALVTPAAVTDLTLIPDATGDKKCTLNFTAPTLAKDGTQLDALTKIEIRRNGDLAGTIDNPVPGAAQTYTDLVAVNGTYTYTVTAFTTAGGGDPASATTFVGINVPASAVNVKAENASNLAAKISWEAPKVDKDGYPIAASRITYDIFRKALYSSESTTVAEDIAELEYTDEIPAEVGVQQFYTYSVVAHTAEGEAAATTANPVPLGEPYAVPFYESFPKGRASHIYTSTPLVGNCYWSQTTDFEDVSSADSDNGMLYLNGQINGAASYFTGLINLADMAAPTLNFYTYNIPGADPADNTLQVTVTATDGTVKAFDEFSPGMGWTKTILRLDDLAGKTIRVNFNGYRYNNTILHLDAIAISSIYRSDLRLNGITVPEKVRTSEPFDVVVDVLNFGSEASSDYEVELYCNGTKVDSYNATALAMGAHDMVHFTRTHSIMDGDKATYSARIIAAVDDNPGNNESEPVETTIRRNSYPTVGDLAGEIAENGAVTLIWSEPDTQKAQPYETTENWDSYDSWANANVGDWTFVDRDGGIIAGFIEQVMPGIDAYSQQSWWVFDGAHEDFNNGSFATLSGYKFLASMVTGNTDMQAIQNDDWVISPELFGGAQTITVNARSYSMIESDFESFEVLYSTGSLNPDDFISVAKFENIPSDYTAYEIDLPDGAKRFAVRNISFKKYILMVDDITYIPVGDPAAFSINGYNVYRDGVKINAEPVEENEYEDLTAPAGEHNYHVTVLYSAGESQLSNTWSSTQNSIGNISVDTAAPEYFNLQGLRVATPQPGQIYIVRRGTKTAKVFRE